MTCALWKNRTDDMYERRMWISPTNRGKAQRGGEHMSSAQIHVWKSQKKQPHVNTYPKNTHNKGKTRPKGMKAHQKGNTIESGLFFMCIVFFTFGDFSLKKRQSAKRREHMSSAQWMSSRCWSVQLDLRVSHTHQRHWKLRPTDDMRFMNTMCAGSSRWHVLKGFWGYVRVSACHPAPVLHCHGHSMFCLLSDWYHNCARFMSTNSCFLGRWFTISSLKDWSLCPDLWLCTLVWREWRSDLMSFVSPCILLDPWSQCFFRVYIIYPSLIWSWHL